MSMEGDTTPVVAGLEGGNLTPDGAEEPIFEIAEEEQGDTGGQSVATDAGQTITAAPPPPAEPDQAAVLAELRQRNADIERQFNQLAGMLSPLIQRQQQPDNEPPPVDPAEVRAGNVTPEQLAAFVDWQIRQGQRQIQVQAQQAALRATSEQQVRGQFNPNILPDGFDYDTMRGKYFAAIERTNPAIRQLVSAIFPANPALGEYWVSMLTWVAEQQGDDPIKTAQAFVNAVKAPATASKQTVTNIQQAARRGAAKIIAGSSAGGRGPNRRVTGDDIMNMSDAEFAAFDRQFGARN